MTPTPRRNNEAARTYSLKQLAELVGGELIGDPGITITGVAGIKEAKKGDITFLSQTRYLSFLGTTQASAVITSKNVTSDQKPIIRTANPSEAFSKLIAVFIPSRPPRKPGIHPSAFVAPSAIIGKNVYIGPHAVVEDGVSIADNAVIEANSVIGADCVIGESSLIYSNVTIRERVEIGKRVIIHSGAVIGSDGFGYETENGLHQKISHVGTVLIEDDVEIGSNTCIDRGRFDKTWIKRGTKIDNLVQIAHNVIIGENCLIIAQVGISGSVELGDQVVLAGQCGVVGHIKLGNKVMVGARAGVSKAWPDGTILLGEPARPWSETKRIVVLTARLPELFKDLAEIKKKLSIE